MRRRVLVTLVALACCSGVVGGGAVDEPAAHDCAPDVSPSPTPPTLPGADGAADGSAPASPHASPPWLLPPVPPDDAPLAPLDVWGWREGSREAIHHALGSYATFAYPADELLPLSCGPRVGRERGDLDDALLGASLTLVDALDALATTGDAPAFRCAVSALVAHAAFTSDANVSVFETNIRVVGGLLAGHLLSVDPALHLWDAPPAGNGGGGSGGGGHGGCRSPRRPRADLCAAPALAAAPCLPRYDGQLLAMARELAARLLPAFDTPTGLPLHRVNLRTGAPDVTARVSCPAAAGTFLLEFGLLSRLTGEPEFEAVARRAVAALWARRSHLGLFGVAIDVLDGGWRAAHSGVGAGVDSYLEYLLKAGVALDDGELLAMYEDAARAVAAHVDTPSARVHVEVMMGEGRAAPRAPVVLSPLAAWYPGAEVLAGRPGDARAHWRGLAAAWALHAALPEGYDVGAGRPVPWARDAPLRPELAESTFLLYAATRDAALVRHAAAQLDALTAASRVRCGFAAVADVESGRLDDRMDSFFISETLRYLFQTFDAALTGWFDGPPGEPSWRRPSRAQPAAARNASWPFRESASAAALLAPPPAARLAPPPPAAERATAAGRARDAHVARLAALFPNAHPLAFERYDDGGGLDDTDVDVDDDSLPALPLDAERVLYSTEGHALLLTSPRVHVHLRTLPSHNASSASTTGRHAARTQGRMGAVVGPASSSAVVQLYYLPTCPILLPAVHAAPPVPPGAFVDAIMSAWGGWGTAHSPQETIRGLAKPVSTQSGVCSVAKLRSALRPAVWVATPSATWADGNVSAVSAQLGSVDEGLSPYIQSAYPLVGSADLSPSALSTAWQTDVLPALRGDLFRANAMIAATVFSAGVAVPNQFDPNAAAVLLAAAAAAAQKQASTADASDLEAEWLADECVWRVSEWTGSEFFPASQLAEALAARIGIHLLMSRVLLKCQAGARTYSCVLGSSAPSLHLVYRVSIDGGDVASRSSFLAASAQFGPLITGAGLGPLHVYAPTDDDGRGCAQLPSGCCSSNRTLVVVRRGGCSFAQKATRANAAGAAAVLVLDGPPAEPVTLDYTMSPGGIVATSFALSGDAAFPAEPSVPSVFVPNDSVALVDQALEREKYAVRVCITAALGSVEPPLSNEHGVSVDNDSDAPDRPSAASGLAPSQRRAAEELMLAVLQKGPVSFETRRIFGGSEGACV